MFGGGTTGRDYAYVDDTVSGFLAALDHVRERRSCYEIVNLGNDRTIALADMIKFG